MKYKTNRKRLKNRALAGFEHIVDNDKLRKVNPRMLELFCDWDIESVASAYQETVVDREIDSFDYFAKVFRSHHDDRIKGKRPTDNEELIEEFETLYKYSKAENKTMYDYATDEGKKQLEEHAKKKHITVEELELKVSKVCNS